MANTEDFDLGAWARQRQEAAERAAGVKPTTPTTPPAAPALGQPTPMTPGQSELVRGAELAGGQVLPGMIHSVADPINLLHGAITGQGQPVLGTGESLIPAGWQPSQDPTMAGFGERMAAAAGRGFGEGIPYGAAVGTALGIPAGPGGMAAGAGLGALTGGGVGALSAMGAEATHEMFPSSRWAPTAVGTALSMVNPIQAARSTVQHAIPALAALVGYHSEGLIGAAVGWLGAHGITQALTPATRSRLWQRAPIGFQAGQERANQPAAPLPSALAPTANPIPGLSLTP